MKISLSEYSTDSNYKYSWASDTLKVPTSYDPQYHIHGVGKERRTLVKLERQHSLLELP